MDWLPRTRLHPPLLRDDIIPRPRLLTALREAVTSHPLTLLSAPAGYGKTTLLSDFRFQISDFGLGRTDDDQIRNLQSFDFAQDRSAICNSVAWLTLDGDDNHPTHFLMALIAALGGLNPACGATARNLLRDSSLESTAGATDPAALARRVVGVLINDVLETLPDPFLLVLDDLHLITKTAVHLALDYLIAHLPAQMHLVIATRHDPPLSLARLRARGQLAELRLPDLRFTPQEAATFLNDQLRLNLSPADLTALQTRTEGWAASLRLLANSLERLATPAERSAFVAHLARTDRLIFDFLAEEVLRQQEPHVRAFLLETAILAELTPALCQAVTGQDNAEAVLEDLYRRNLFLIATNDERRPTADSQQPRSAVSGRWSYRYHALFAAFLRARLRQEMPERIPELHRRAAAAQAIPADAVGHYLAAEMWAEAADAVERVAEEQVLHGRKDTVRGWIERLPVALRETRPRLAYYLGLCHLYQGVLESAWPLLDRARQGFATAGDESGEGQALLSLAICAFLQADFARSHRLIGQALTHAIPFTSRVQLLMGRALMSTFTGDWSQVQADFEQALAETRQSGDPEVLHALAMALNPLFAVQPGALAQVEAICQQAGAHFGGEISATRVTIETMNAFAHLWRGRLPQAIRAGERALATRARAGCDPTLDVDPAIIVAMTRTALGDYAAAERFFAIGLREAGRPGLEQTVVAVYLYYLGRARWLQGRVDAAREVYAQMCAAEHPQEMPPGIPARLQLRGLLALADGQYAAAETVLRQAVALEEQIPAAALLGSARLLLARLYLDRNRPAQALAEAAPVLAECQQQDTPGRILQLGTAVVPLLRLAVEQGVHPDPSVASFAAHLLDLLSGAKNLADDKPRPLPVPETGETLTPREVEVLKLLATGATNRGIAAQLVISERTVKTHLYHAYQKLAVSSRTEAAARARQLGI